ncbi:hypothetical protein ACFQJ7_03700 [Halovenus rubra]|uniref:Uncharacterized protein n=2 Tax=Halovenus rubra TaxID=869890 RepID=A0ACC7DWH8_9EURY|nr:hypothetical protein [Halovenus rubra]
MAQEIFHADVHLSQLYRSSEKLADVLAWFDFDDLTYEPLPVFGSQKSIVAETPT